MKILTLIMGIFLFVSLSFAGTIDPNTPDSKYLEYGEKFEHTVKLCCFDGVGLSCGSAVIIDSHWIITAAHVVDNCQTWTVTIKEETYELSKVVLNPNYKTDVFGYYDIALGYSEKAFAFDKYPELYESSDEIGKICCMAGWGNTGDFNTGANTSDKKRRGGSNYIDSIQRNVLVCSPSRRQEKFTELEFLIASGDSGGGLFIDGKLAGIHSSVMAKDGKPNGTYTDQSCHSRVSTYIKWIRETMESCNEEKE